VKSGADFDPAAAARSGREVSFPLEVAALKTSDKLPGWRGTLPSDEASFASVEPGNVVLTALKPAEDGAGLVMRVLETAGRQTDGSITLPFLVIDSAREANAVEVPGAPLNAERSRIAFHVSPHQVLTLRISARPGPN
jgi:alpha-mannosidase